MPETPIIENIHAKVLEAVSREGALDMLDNGFHKSTQTDTDGAYCGTTHCRGGWVIVLAGKPGIDLENIFGSENAAMQIYNKSSNIKVSPVRFYEPNEIAMADIKRCAELEKNNLTK